MGAVETEPGKFAQLNVPGVGLKSMWRSAPPTAKYWSQHRSSLIATITEPRHPENVAFIAPSWGALPWFSKVSRLPSLRTVRTTRWVRRSPGRHDST